MKPSDIIKKRVNDRVQKVFSATGSGQIEVGYMFTEEILKYLDELAEKDKSLNQTDSGN